MNFRLMVGRRKIDIVIERHRTGSLDSSVLEELSGRYRGDFYRIISELPGIAVGTIIKALNDPALSDVKDHIVQRTREIAEEEMMVMEDITDRLGITYTVFWRYRGDIGLDDNFVERKKAELLIGIRNEYQQHWVRDLELDVGNPRDTLDELLHHKLAKERDVSLKHLVDLLYAGGILSEDKRAQYKLMAGSMDLILTVPWAFRLFNELSQSGIGSPLELVLKIQERNNTGHSPRYFMEALDIYGLIPENKGIEYRLFSSASSFYKKSPMLKSAPQFDDKMEAIGWAYRAKIREDEDNELRDLSLSYIITALALGGNVPREKASTAISLAGKADYAIRNKGLFEEELHQAYQSMDMAQNYNKEDGKLSRYKFMGNLFVGIDSTKFKRQDNNEPLSPISLRAAFNMAMALYGLQFLYSKFKDERLNQIVL